MEGRSMSYNAIYKLESGAAKKRRKEEEEKSWRSKNGPVIVKKAKDGKG
jgi:hypothetical protein